MDLVIIYKATWTEQVIKRGVRDAHWGLNNTLFTIHRLNGFYAWIVSHRATNSHIQMPITENYDFGCKRIIHKLARTHKHQ